MLLLLFDLMVCMRNYRRTAAFRKVRMLLLGCAQRKGISFALHCGELTVEAGTPRLLRDTDESLLKRDTHHFIDP